MARPPSKLVPLLIIAGAALLIIAGASLLGYRWLHWEELTSVDGSAFYRFRLPRTILSALVGASLALGGVVFQSLFRNPLAEPYTLGLAGGASFGAALGFLLGVSGQWLGFPLLGLCAAAGVGVAMLLVVCVSAARAGRDMTRLLLAGVCVSYLAAAGVLLVFYLTQDGVVTAGIVRWMMGSVEYVSPAATRSIAVVFAVTFAYALYSCRALDLLSMGEHLAASRGVNVAGVVRLSFVLTGLLTAAVVATCGPIGFIGLMAPHITRALVGQRALPLLVGSVFVGAAFLSLCDGVARTFPYQPAVGLVTNIIGAVFFFILLLTRDVNLARSH